MLDTAPDQRAEAVRRYEHRRHQALWSFLVPTLICWVVYVAAALDDGPGFPWPLFVTLGAASDPEAPGDQLIDGYWMGLSKRSLQVA